MNRRNKRKDRRSNKRQNNNTTGGNNGSKMSNSNSDSKNTNNETISSAENENSKFRQYYPNPKMREGEPVTEVKKKRNRNRGRSRRSNNVSKSSEDTASDQVPTSAPMQGSKIDFLATEESSRAEESDLNRSTWEQTAEETDGGHHGRYYVSNAKEMTKQCHFISDDSSMNTSNLGLDPAVYESSLSHDMSHDMSRDMSRDMSHNLSQDMNADYGSTYSSAKSESDRETGPVSSAEPEQENTDSQVFDKPLPVDYSLASQPLWGQLEGGSKVKEWSCDDEQEEEHVCVKDEPEQECDCDCYEEESEEIEEVMTEKEEEDCKIEKMECEAFQKGSGDGKVCAKVKVKFGEDDSSDERLSQSGRVERCKSEKGSCEEEKDMLKMKPVICCPPGSCTLQIEPDCDVITVDTCQSCPAKFVVCQSELTISMKRRALKYLESFEKDINNAEIFRKFEKSPFAVNLPHTHCLKEFIRIQEMDIEKLKVDIVNTKALLKKTTNFSRNFIRAAETEQSMIACAGDAVSDEAKCKEVKRIMRIVKIIESERRVRSEIEVESETIRNRLEKILATIEKVKRRIVDLNTGPFHPCSKDADQIIAGLWTYAEALIERRKRMKEDNRKFTKMLMEWKDELRDLIGVGQNESILNVAMVALINYLKIGKFSCNADIPTILHQLYPKFLGDSKMLSRNISTAYDEFQNVIDGKYGLPDVECPSFEFSLTSPTTSFEDGVSAIRLRDLIKTSPWIHKTTRQFLKIVSKV